MRHFALFSPRRFQLPKCGQICIEINDKTQIHNKYCVSWKIRLKQKYPKLASVHWCPINHVPFAQSNFTWDNTEAVETGIFFSCTFIQ